MIKTLWDNRIIRPIYYIFNKEVIEIRRSKVLKLLVLAPIIQMIIFGYVATTDIKHVKMLICDEDSSALSRELSAKFYNTEYFNVVDFTRNGSEIQKTFTESRVSMALRIPEGFSSKIKKGEKTSVQLIIDGSDSNMASIALNRGTSIVKNYSKNIFAERMYNFKKLAGTLPTVKMEERVWFNPALISANTMVPGVIGLIIMIVTMAATSVSLVREKESGNMEQIIVTPVKPYQYITGKTLPYVAIALVDIVLITFLSILIFKLSFVGSFTLLIALSVPMILANLGIGILISTISSTQQQAMLAVIFVFIPNMLLSGFIFPIKNMPEVLQWLTYAIPLRYYMVIIRGIFLKGLVFSELLPQIGALLIFSTTVFTLAILRFKKKLS